MSSLSIPISRGNHRSIPDSSHPTSRIHRSRIRRNHGIRDIHGIRGTRRTHGIRHIRGTRSPLSRGA